MTDRNMRWARVTKASADKGPHKLVEIETDGKTMDVYVGEVFGVQSSPHVGAMVLVALPDGDEGKGVIIASMPRPKDRKDGQKEGETSFINVDTGNTLQHDADGHTNQKTKADLKQEVGANHSAKIGGSQTTEVASNITFKSGGILHLNPG